MRLGGPLKADRRRGLGLLGAASAARLRPYRDVGEPARLELSTNSDHAGRTASAEQVAQLQLLGELRRSGVLTDDQFQREKARILG